MTDYQAYIAARAQLANAGGFEPSDLPGHLFDFPVGACQRAQEVAS